ncbi:MAG TPA: glycosyltransferase, partial [Patescibacteria group bacterium]|nr:glycosyltransferase [Patescibacteria group bacterium]
MNLCAIVPSHNHHTVIASVVARLRALGLPVFVIDDGSSEPARSAIAALAGDGVTLRRFEDNQGKGAAVVDGFRLAAAAGFTHAVQVDADGQHDLDALPALLAAAEESPDALVSGEPVYDASMPLGRKIGRWITHIWVWIETLSLRITDSMCGFRVYPLAAVLALLAEESVGRRMDFDTDIMVRLFWRGTPVRMVPVRVVYPPANTSNFDMLRDNVRISWMHTRLVLSMLCRQWCKRSPQVASHWSALGERGAYWGLRFCAGAYRLLGRRGCLVFMAPIVFYFFAFGRQQRRASQTFLSRALNRPVRLRESYRHFLGFAARALDTFIAWTGGARADAVHIANGEVLAQAMTDP